MTLAEAREKARALRRLLLDKQDPLEHRRAERQRRALAAASTKTFADCAERYIAAHRKGWRNGKHAAQWQATLATYANPVLGELAVRAIDTRLVLRVLEPIWTAKPETASRVRGRIEAVLDWAAAKGYRQGENPARWRGHLQKLLPPREQGRSCRAPRCAALRRSTGLHGAAARPGGHRRPLPRAHDPDGRQDRRSDRRAVGGDRPRGRDLADSGRAHESGKEHVVPLSDQVLELLAALPRSQEATSCLKGPVRAGRSAAGPMMMTLRRMGHGELTVHGFRSTFRDWAAEQTDHPNHVVEMALAHTIGDKVEAAYRRSDLLEKRRALMQDWADYCQAAQPSAMSGGHGGQGVDVVRRVASADPASDAA